MNIKFLDKFRLLKEQEEFNVVKNNIEKDAAFHGTNLWILFFAILVASLGLNINSTAVVIGAMLISPLMGPIVSAGFGVAVNDLTLIRKSLGNYMFAIGVGLAASTIYFLLSPIRDAHSEILARTQPNIYDVLISFFGGFAGIIAVSSKQKGNVIAGVAIATALMPPLCTAGYGLATGQLNYFFGAFYLYLINSVFIVTATIITVHILKYPVKKYADPKGEKRERRIIWAIIIVTLIPSLYFGYDIVQKNKFISKASRFIKSETTLPNDYLLKEEVDAAKKKITLTYGGKEISAEEVSGLKNKLKYYGLENCSLEVKQGFALPASDRNVYQVAEVNLALNKIEEKRAFLKAKLDSITYQQNLCRQVEREMKIQYPEFSDVFIEQTRIMSDTSQIEDSGYLVVLNIKTEFLKKDNDKLNNWLKIRLNNNNVKIAVEKNP